MKIHLLTFCILFGVFLSCGNNEKKASGKLTLDDCPVIAQSTVTVSVYPFKDHRLL